MMNYPRRLPLNGTYNTRDLGGYPIQNGGITRYGVFLRSDLGEGMTERDFSLLKEYRVDTVIDLRAPDECEREPDDFAKLSGVRYYNCPFSAGNRLPVSREDFAVIYGEILSCHEDMRRTFSLLAASEGCALYHCAAGKDRTGVISALLLLLAGVSVSDVLADYQVSYTYIREWVRNWRHENRLGEFCGTSDMEYMEQTLDRFFAEYGNVETYLSAIGLTKAEIKILADKLTKEKQ